jgi:hypothetical protein
MAFIWLGHSVIKVPGRPMLAPLCRRLQKHETGHRGQIETAGGADSLTVAIQRYHVLIKAYQV